MECSGINSVWKWKSERRNGIISCNVVIFFDFPGKICSSYKHYFDENSVSSVATSNICDSETEKKSCVKHYTNDLKLLPSTFCILV